MIMSFTDFGILFFKRIFLYWKTIQITYRELQIMKKKEFMQCIYMIHYMLLLVLQQLPPYQTPSRSCGYCHICIHFIFKLHIIINRKA